jgi:hypothetical protein
MKTKKPRAKKANTTKKPPESPSILSDVFFSLRDMAMKPYSENYVLGIVKIMTDQVLNDEDVLTFTTVLKKNLINWHTWDSWCKKYPFAKEAYTMMRVIIGERREVGGLKRKLDSGMVSYTMAAYDPNWKNLAEWRAKLKQEAETPTEAKVVIIEKFPEENEK